MSYGRNFEFRVPPYGGQREARFALDASSDPIPIGAPVVYNDGGENDLGLTIIELATGAQPPVPGLSGIAVFEHKMAEAFAGFDPWLTTYSDIDLVPPGGAVQVVRGDTVKVCLRNTEDRVFLQTRNYTGRTMIAGLGATPTVAIGDFLTPGTGTDAAGYWAEGSAANAWLVVTKVDPDRGEVEARMAF